MTNISKVVIIIGTVCDGRFLGHLQSWQRNRWSHSPVSQSHSPVSQSHSPVSQSSVEAVTLALSYAGTLVSPFMWLVSLPQLCAGTCQMSMSVHCHTHGDVTSLIWVQLLPLKGSNFSPTGDTSPQGVLLHFPTSPQGVLPHFPTSPQGVLPHFPTGRTSSLPHRAYFFCVVHENVSIRRYVTAKVCKYYKSIYPKVYNYYKNEVY